MSTGNLMQQFQVNMVWNRLKKDADIPRYLVLKLWAHKAEVAKVEISIDNTRDGVLSIISGNLISILNRIFLFPLF